MKESNFYSDEFEHLISEKTEQYKMYPSEKVWKGIHGSLHTKRKWFIGSMSILVIGILFLAGKELITPAVHLTLSQRKTAPAGSTEGSASKATTGNITRTSFSTLRENISSSTVRHSSQTSDDPSFDDQPYKGITITISNPVISQPDLSEVLSHVVKLPAEVPSLPVIAGRGAVAEEGTAAAERGPDGSMARSGIDGIGATTGIAADGGSGRGGMDGLSVLSARNMMEGQPARSGADVRNSRVGRGGLATTKSGQGPIVRKETIPDSAGEATKTSATTIAEAIDRQGVNWLQDYAVYTLPSSPKRARTFLQLTLSPTINYRTLSGGEFSPKSLIQNVPIALMHPGNAADYVDHAPAVGFELGGSLLYRVTRNLTVKGGLQFNFSRYKIRAYASSPQQATINLNSYYGYYMDSITSISSIRNFGGSTQEILNNDYYQLSAPIGFELRVLGNERLQFNLGATIQPTYLLNTNSYMLSSDYTNYTKEPSLFRRWNLNGGVEAFLSYKTSSGIRWQIGPEFRYQLLSTYNDKYPVHENLKGYGIKIGITKVIP